MKRDRPAYVYEKGRNKLLYFCKRGAKPVRIHSAIGTPEFAAEYALLMRGRQLAPSKTMRALIASYKASKRWEPLKPNTRRSYTRHLDWFAAKMGEDDPTKLRRHHVIAMRDALADKPTDASRKVAVLSVLMEHAIDIGWLREGQNPAKDVKLLKGNRDPREPWPEDMVEAFRREAPALPLLIFELCLGTGQRIGDVLQMRWDAIKDGGLPVRQDKTGAGLWVPFTPRLAALLEATPRLGATIVAQPNGKPVAYNTAAKYVQRVREKIGAMPWDIHSLRHAAASEIAALPGMTMEHVRAITGHTSDEMARLYAGKAAQKARAKEVQEARE